MSRIARALNALFPQGDNLTVYHCCLRAEAAKIQEEGFAPPHNEAKMFWMRPEAFGQRKEDRVSFGFAGIAMLQWVAMKAAHAAITGEEPKNLVVLEVEVPRASSRAFWSVASIGGLAFPGMAPELTCPRNLVRVKRQLTVKEVLALPPRLPGIEAVKETVRDFRAAWKHRKELELGMAIPGLIVTQAVWADTPEGPGKKVAGISARFAARRAERQFQQLDAPYEGLAEAWGIIREILQAQGDAEAVKAGVERFNLRAEEALSRWLSSVDPR